MDANAVDTEQDNGKPWTIHDEYRFAPKREGDPWQRILDPVLEREKIRCDGWKDEVGNLLIFAGLFSAVVTAFIIESYKTLQPDPNDDIVGLLFQISSLLNGTRNEAASTPSILSVLPSQSFIPTHSAVRVNIFWFLSLIFSLPTVLIGIVTLQWLREYQAYPGQSAREVVAIHHMRSQGMERWQVWKVLTALPLLLQMALVLFFIGIIDFLGALGNKAVAGSVTVVVALTLFFLIATTTLPAAQVVFLRLLLVLPFRFREPPSQCPYKSPQSHLFCAISAAFPQALASLLSALWYPFRKSFGVYRSQRIERLFTKPFRKPITKNNLPVRYYLSELWSKTTWIDFDSTWLWVRDACSRGSHDKDFSLQGVEISWDLSPIIALYDVTAVVCHLDVDIDIYRYLDMYHCFSDLSKAFTVSNTKHRSYRASNLSILWRRNIYLRSLTPLSAYAKDDDLVEHLRPDTGRWGDDFTVHSDAIKALHDMNIYRFLIRNIFDPQSQIFLHQQEIVVRLQNYLFARKTIHPPQVNLPLYLYFGRWMSIESPQRDANVSRSLPLSSADCASPPSVAVSQQQILSLTTFFRYICKPGTIISPGDIHGHRDIWSALRLGGRNLSMIITQPAGARIQGYAKLSDALTTFMNNMADILTASYHPQNPPTNMLYASHYAAIFLQPIGIDFRGNSERGKLFPQILLSYERLLAAIHMYLKHPIDGGNPAMEALNSLLSFLGDHGGGIDYYIELPQAQAPNVSDAEHLRHPHLPDNRPSEPTSCLEAVQAESRSPENIFNRMPSTSS